MKRLSNQVDLFDLFEVKDSEDFLNGGDRPDPLELLVGDILRVITWGGDRLEGRLATCGFWDGRDQKRPEYYYFEVQSEKGTMYRQFNPYLNEWRRLGHDDSYQLPRKDNITEECSLFLRDIPFPKRLERYRTDFQSRYPYLSYEYSSLVSEAWNQAICEVTTEEELLDHQKNWEWTPLLPREVVNYIKAAVFPLPGQERTKALSQIKFVKGKSQHGASFSYHVPLSSCSVYGPLFSKMIQETTNPTHLVIFSRIKGAQIHQVYRHGEKPPGYLWLENEEGTVQDLLIPYAEQLGWLDELADLGSFEDEDLSDEEECCEYELDLV